MNSNVLTTQQAIESLSETSVGKDSYYHRNFKVVDASDELLAFQANQSQRIQDTISKARDKGIPVTVFSYKIDIT